MKKKYYKISDKCIQGSFVLNSYNINAISLDKLSKATGIKNKSRLVNDIVQHCYLPRQWMDLKKSYRKLAKGA